MDQDLTAISKFLSFVLRHEPASIGLRLDPAGWAFVDELIACAARHGRRLTPELLREVVATSDKQRFALDGDGARIRANQGHSVRVDLGLVPVAPPDRLYHGTATRFLASIRSRGLIPGERQFVHLSPDVETAERVGARHGRPVVLAIRAAAAALAGHAFFRSENGVWLTGTVPVHYIDIPEPRR